MRVTMMRWSRAASSGPSRVSLPRGSPRRSKNSAALTKSFASQARKKALKLRRGVETVAGSATLTEALALLLLLAGLGGFTSAEAVAV